MDVEAFRQHPKLRDIIARARAQCGGQAFSDIIDDAGHQYVDLVMEGGGMLGIGLVGYCYVLEQLGIRFCGIGGTSAGSINALLLAALGRPQDAKGDKLLAELANQNFYEFIDGDSDAREFIEAALKGAGKMKLAFKGAQVIDNILEDWGLNPGRAFERWLTGILAAEGIHTHADLHQRMTSLPPGLRLRNGEALTAETAGFGLALIAADVSTETKVQFPKMAGLYWHNADAVNPALFARASMSIPYFFEPLRIPDLPTDDAALLAWKELAGYDVVAEQGLPKEAIFVDGGVLSNFPIDVFHDHTKEPAAPTFGVKLELDQRRKCIDGPGELAGAMFNSARHCLDYEFIRRNPDYRKLVSWIPAKGYDWLDFNMSDDDKLGLFLEGAEVAANFLSGFSWLDYKRIRRGIAEAGQASF